MIGGLGCIISSGILTSEDRFLLGLDAGDGKGFKDTKGFVLETFGDPVGDCVGDLAGELTGEACDSDMAVDFAEGDAAKEVAVSVWFPNGLKPFTFSESGAFGASVWDPVDSWKGFELTGSSPNGLSPTGSVGFSLANGLRLIDVPGLWQFFRLPFPVLTGDFTLLAGAKGFVSPI